MANRIFTVGYEGQSISPFVERLKAAGVSSLLDVRAVPISRKKGFSKSSLKEALEGIGISYFHDVNLGCPKQVRDRYRADGDWAVYTRGFLAHLAANAEAIAAAAALTESSSTCLLCFEADYKTCHRMYVARSISALNGASIVHLTDQKAILERPTSQVAA